MTQDEPNFDPSLTQESMTAEHYKPDLLADIVKAIPPMPPEHGTKVIKHVDWLINQARAADKRKIEELKAKVLLLREALKPAAEKWRYSGFTKAGANPTTEYFDIRVTREELAAMHTAYHDT